MTTQSISYGGRDWKEKGKSDNILDHGRTSYTQLTNPEWWGEGNLEGPPCLSPTKFLTQPHPRLPPPFPYTQSSSRHVLHRVRMIRGEGKNDSDSPDHRDLRGRNVLNVLVVQCLNDQPRRRTVGLANVLVEDRSYCGLLQLLCPTPPQFFLFPPSCLVFNHVEGFMIQGG